MDSLSPPMLGVLVVVILASLVLSQAIITPLFGVLVRFRAHYNPKGLQLDMEGDVQSHTGPATPSFFGMLGRVYKIEGRSGLYKGLMPELLSNLVLTLSAAMFLGISNLRPGMIVSPCIGVTNALPFGVFVMLLSLPLEVITNRAITTPHKLPYFSPRYSLRVLLTPNERRRPWILYLTPGFLAAKVMNFVCATFLRSVRLLLFGPMIPGLPTIVDTLHFKIVILLVVALLSALVLTPLEVIILRLSIQRNSAASEFNTIGQEGGADAESAVEYAGADEDVIYLRADREPYVSLVDCTKRIVDEEGWGALYRAWWLTILMIIS